MNELIAMYTTYTNTWTRNTNIDK